MSTQKQFHSGSLETREMKGEERLSMLQQDFTKIDRFFDTAEHIVERSEVLLSKSKPAIISLFLLLHLVIDLVVVLIFVLTK
jgi:hypothetical protein